MEISNSEIYSLTNIKRFNTSCVIKTESVAEHTAIVCLLVLKMHNEYDFDLFGALKYALIHDMHEIYLSDIPHNIKNMHRQLNDICNTLENSINKTMMIDDIQNCVGSREKTIVTYCDILSVTLYCSREAELGNSMILPILQDSEKRLLHMCNELKNIRRK